MIWAAACIIAVFSVSCVAVVAYRRHVNRWMRCPICGGPMYEHDVGYDECGCCEFFVIYYDGRLHGWTKEELQDIYRDAGLDWGKDER